MSHLDPADAGCRSHMDGSLGDRKRRFPDRFRATRLCGKGGHFAALLLHCQQISAATNPTRQPTA
jgi:hypothetical protein